MKSSIFSVIVITLFLIVASSAGAQRSTPAKQDPGFALASKYFEDIRLHIDTNEYSLHNNRIRVNEQEFISFQYSKEDDECEILLIPKPSAGISNLFLIGSGDFTIVDSLMYVNDYAFRGKIRFSNLSKTNFTYLRFAFRDGISQEVKNLELPVFPVTSTMVKLYSTTDELFIGEEKVFELTTNNVNNVVADGVWTSGQDIDYMFSKQGQKLRLHVLPNQMGNRSLKALVKTLKPYLNAQAQPIYELDPLEYNFSVKVSRLSFLNTDRRDVIAEEDTPEGIPIQIDYNRNIQLQKTYRIEAQEEPGGKLIAELFTRSELSTNKILCWLRVYNYHRISDGYLFIKDGDKPKFITNFNIFPQTSISKISIQREGADYTENLSVFPGETVDVKIEGVSLDRVGIRFEDITEASRDSLIRSENVAMIRIKVPLNISKRKLIIYTNGRNSGFALTVKEFQRARPLDFIDISYGDQPMQQHVVVNTITAPIMYRKALKDVVISALPDKIDEDGRLYGKQYLKIKITVKGSKQELIEMRTIENIVVCPGVNSARYASYDKKGCLNSVISLNSYLSRKTLDLGDWSRIELEIMHDADKHQGEAYTQRIDIVLERRVNFDVDVSFPAGLVTVRPDKPVGEQLGSFGGVSLAAIAQFSFFKPGRIAQYQPYRFGVGTIALNAFDFSQNNNNRGLALVGLGSLSPIRKDVKLRFVLYGGGGYLLSNNPNNPSGWFFLIGPGIMVRL
jgi:hypothetical protein